MKAGESSKLITYALGAGGRICDFPSQYLDVVAEAIIMGNPRYVTHEICELLVSGRFRRSQHYQLRDLSLIQLRRRTRRTRRYHYELRLARTTQAVI